MFPTPYTVGHRQWSAAGVDGHGNTVVAFSPPVDMAVYGWAPATADETFGSSESRVVTELRLYVPAGTDIRPRDQVVLPSGTFEVHAHPEDFNYGPFGWRPGVVVNLRRVEG